MPATRRNFFNDKPHRLAEVLSHEQIKNQIVVVPGQSHARMVLAMSRPDQTAGLAIMKFIKDTIPKE